VGGLGPPTWPACRDHRTIRKTLAGFRRGAGFAVVLWRFSARITAIRANISGPSRSATSNSVSIATCRRQCAAQDRHDLVRRRPASGISEMPTHGNDVRSLG
jgi:hypothetical protein